MTRGGLLALSLLLGACGGDAAEEERGAPADRRRARAVVATSRQANRSYDGAPPVITHSALGACITCHGAQRIQVPGLGVAPPHPHGETPGMAVARCEQCHVFQRTDEEFRGSTFRAWESDAGDRRAFEGAPPTMPHRTFGHEDCLSCHGSPTTPESLHCSHPERARCAQCHVEADTGAVFQR